MSLLNRQILNRIIIGIIYLSLFLLASKYESLLFLILFLSSLLITSLLEFYKITKKNHNILLKLFVAIIYILTPITCLFLIRFEFTNGDNLLAFLIILVCINDVSAFTVGKLFGKTKLSNISPNKTVEGLFGSFFLCLLIGPFLIKYFQILVRIDSFILSLLISISANFGDYIESVIKRKFNKKDSGRILMSHGGILDRIDSLLISGPFFYCIMKILN